MKSQERINELVKLTIPCENLIEYFCFFLFEILQFIVIIFYLLTFLWFIFILELKKTADDRLVEVKMVRDMLISQQSVIRTKESEIT